VRHASHLSSQGLELLESKRTALPFSLAQELGALPPQAEDVDLTWLATSRPPATDDEILRKPTRFDESPRMVPCDLLKNTADMRLESRLCSVHYRSSLAAFDQGYVGIEHAEIKENVRILYLIIGSSTFWSTYRERLLYEP
jgi:hypothetical protein